MQNDPTPADPSDVTQRTWRVPAKVPVVKFTAAALFALVGVLLADGDPVRLVLAGITSAALVGWGLRDLLLPVRLTADQVGLTLVSGLAGRHRMPWSAVDRIVAHGRGSVRGHQLEIDTGDTVYVLTGSDLGASPDEVAAELLALRAEGSTAG